LLTRPAGQRLLLDGAHNLAGAENLAAAFKELFPAVRPALILGILSDKDWKGMCRILAPMASRILLVPVASERAAVPRELQLACESANPKAEAIVCASLGEALQRVIGEPLTLVAGSLYLVGEALELLQRSSSLGERSLNEWAPKV
jgi:dihydrofolate synthase / folylpolyglutamate synthase